MSPWGQRLLRRWPEVVDDLSTVIGNIAAVLWWGCSRGRFTRARSMKRASLLILILIAATILADCQPGRFTQCDPTNTMGSNCYQQQGPPYRNP
jgi:hypothetical protein